MINVGIYGGSGYTGQELLRLLLGHPEAKVVAATSRRFAGTPVSEIYPALSGRTDLVYTNDTPETVAGLAEFIFLALPHGVSMEIAPFFIRAGHKANPGCYPTSIILGLAPVLRSRWIDPASVIADSKSGVSGAGREPQIASLYCEVEGGFKAYKVGGHRHTPEIEQELGLLAGREMKISFTPHLLPVKRGILSTIYARLEEDVSAAEATALYREFYRDEPFVRICRAGQFPNLSSVVGSNFCDIGVTVDKRTGRLIVVSVIDNLIKGASGQAIQNMNLMAGLPEGTGLPLVALYP